MKTEQKNRVRSRPANDRRATNPLTQIHQSQGPDVRIHGTAGHIAEKYLQLARDAHTGGNPVLAENYLQHAEHYFRLIAAVQAGPVAIGETDPDEPETEIENSGLPDRFALPSGPAAAPAFAAPTSVWPRKAG